MNVESGTHLSMQELAELVAATVGFKGAIITDPSKPDGTPRKLMASDRLKSLDWAPHADLARSLRLNYGWYPAGMESQLLA